MLFRGTVAAYCENHQVKVKVKVNITINGHPASLPRCQVPFWDPRTTFLQHSLICLDSDVGRPL
jgi:hypothetical protein